MKFLVTLGIAFSSLHVFAQKKDTVLIKAGSKDLETHLLHNYKASYDLFSVKDGTELLVGSLEDDFQLIPGKRQALRICKIKVGTNSILDSGLCQLEGLAPIYHKSIQTKKNMNLAFSKEKVKGSIQYKTDDKKTETIDYKTAAPLFDSFYEDLLAKVVNAKKGMLFKFPEYIYEMGGTVWSVGEVLDGNVPSERIVKFYQVNSKKVIVRTTTFILDKSTREILYREYLTDTNKSILRKKS